ncbi:hypothetical protein FOL46_005050 [Perkinsus olseni]|uniref:Uncharacterized protein n=1 Tax=Perkinsus olseni TaxID=32597 RepID=A0A7J6LUJ9_PEROL|nr:hypothetical protein FOL46_005050 [Perkinsus olseni]
MEKGMSLTLNVDDTTTRLAEALLLAWAADAGVPYDSQPRTIGDNVLPYDGISGDVLKVARVIGVWLDHRFQSYDWNDRPIVPTPYQGFGYGGEDRPPEGDPSSDRAPRNNSNAALCIAAGILPADLELGTIAVTRLAAVEYAKALDQSLSVKALDSRA